ncbi:type IV secretion system protein [Dyella sp.]|uniref:type IV secretion system protein n=1 Tax=Dyella sp. TaxID=1869338 RepID=UPI002ED59B9D
MARKNLLRAATLGVLAATTSFAQAQDYVDSTTAPIGGSGSGGEQAVHDAKSYEEQQAQTQVLRKQLDDMAAQLKELKQQTDEAKKGNDAITGSSGQGGLQTQDYAKSVPRNWQETLDGYKSGGRVQELATAMGDKLNAEQQELDGKTGDDAAQYSLDQGVKRSTNGSALNAASYESSVDRIQTLKQLQAQIDKTSSLKEIADLQARIQIENSLIANELIRTQSMNGLLQQNEFAKAYQGVKDMSLKEAQSSDSN